MFVEVLTQPVEFFRDLFLGDMTTQDIEVDSYTECHELLLGILHERTNEAVRTTVVDSQDQKTWTEDGFFATHSRSFAQLVELGM